MRDPRTAILRPGCLGPAGMAAACLLLACSGPEPPRGAPDTEVGPAAASAEVSSPAPVSTGATGPETAPPMSADDPLGAVLWALPPASAVVPGPPAALSADLAGFFRLIEEGRPDVARIRLRKHLAVQPEDGRAMFLFALAHHRERSYSEAVPWFTEAIRHAPDYDPAYYFMGWAQFQLGELDVAEWLWTRHLAHRPDAADTHFGLGLVDLEMGRPERAVERFRTAIGLESDDPDRARSVAKAWARLGDALSDLDRPGEAREALETAVALWPDHHEAWSRLARVARRQGDEDAAERAETEAAAALLRTRTAEGRRP